MDNYKTIFLIYFLFFIGMIVFSLLMNALFLKFSKTLGIRNNNETIIRWGSQSKPALGGISFYMIFILSIASYSIFFTHTEVLLNKQLIGLLTACTIAFLMGLADDAYNTKLYLKLSAQITCAVVLIATGTSISLFSNLFLNYLLTTVWVVGIMNSINMLDNMDSITTMVSITIVVAALSLLYLNNDSFNIHVIILIGVLSSLLGFLYFNWHPSKLYMGDTGSQFLGVFLAAIGIIYFWNTSKPSEPSFPSKQILITVLTFIIPIIDTTTVVINRILKKQSPFVGGKDHTTHHFSYLGLTDKQIAVIFFCLSFISMLFSLFVIKYLDNWNYLYASLFGGYCILLFIILYYPTKIRRGEK